MNPLIEGLLIGPVCFAIGVLVGIKVQHRKLTREVIVQARDIKAWLDTWGMYIVAVILIGGVVLAVQSQRESSASNGFSKSAVQAVEDQNRCLTTFANQLYDSLHPRQTASESLQAADEKFNDALVKLLNDTLSAHPVQATSHADAVALARAAQHKQKVAAALSAERTTNPYPPPPKKVCPK